MSAPPLLNATLKCLPKMMDLDFSNMINVFEHRL
jgi:hypothetical protein